MLRHALRLLLALALGLAPALTRADVYRWVDELGVTHYTTDRDTIPRRYRGESKAIVASPSPVSIPRPTPAPTATPEAAAEPAPAAAPVPAPETLPRPMPEAVAVPAPVATPAPVELPSAAAPAAAPAREMTMSAPTTPPVFPGPPTTPAIPSADPRAAEMADLEARIASDRERLRQIISTKRWESAELASDPSIREIAERLPRLQAELAALRAETVP